jgi:hypothetical protein
MTAEHEAARAAVLKSFGRTGYRSLDLRWRRTLPSLPLDNPHREIMVLLAGQLGSDGWSGHRLLELVSKPS